MGQRAWKQQITALFDSVSFFAPAETERLARAEQGLGHGLDSALTSLLYETDGITGAYGYPLVWNLDRIVTDNLRFRQAFGDIYMPFDHLLFFADAGNGDQFAFSTKPAKSDVYGWNHEDDSRKWVAPDLRTFLTWLATGKVTT